MRILFDHNVPVTLRFRLLEHEVHTAFELGWAELENGQLLRAAKAALFEVMITADQNIIYQQNRETRTIALVVLSTNRRDWIQPGLNLLRDALTRCGVGSYERVVFLPPRR